MAQHDQNIANDFGANVRTDINAALAALFSTSSGTSAPSTTVAYQPWADTTSGLLKIRNAANSAWVTVGTLADFRLGTQDLLAGATLLNGYLDWTVSGNALTAAVKTLAGADPSSTDPVTIIFRDPAASTGSPVRRQLTAATSVTASSGSTLGTLNNVAFRFWCVAFDDAGTVRLGLIHCVSGTSVFPLAGWGIASSTAEGGAGAADSAQVFYTGTAVTSKAYATLGYATYEAGLSTAGTYAGAPSRMQLFGALTPLPGQTLQMAESRDSAVATGTTTLPTDDTIPQNTEGTQFMSQAITPTSAANLLRIRHKGYYANTTTEAFIAGALFQDSVANALTASIAGRDGTASARSSLDLDHAMRAGTSSSTTFKVRVGSSGAGTTTFNGQAGAREFGGVANSVLRVEEMMT